MTAEPRCKCGRLRDEMWDAENGAASTWARHDCPFAKRDPAPAWHVGIGCHAFEAAVVTAPIVFVRLAYYGAERETLYELDRPEDRAFVEQWLADYIRQHSDIDDAYINAARELADIVDYERGETTYARIVRTREAR